MVDWKITNRKSFNARKPVFIEGLPGLGNVGKIAVDFIVEEVKAKKVLEFFSYSLPNSVFVTEDNLIEMPKIELYHKKVGNKDFLFLIGDVQPVDEYSSYMFSEKLLDLCQKYNCSEIITLGGIGIDEVPKKPKIFCTGNNAKLVDTFKSFKVNNNIYGHVGPIVGVSGLLLGLSKKRKLPAASLLAETFGHPYYIGFRGAKKILQVLNKKYDFGVSMKKINSEIRKMESEINPKKKKKLPSNQFETSYIG